MKEDPINFDVEYNRVDFQQMMFDTAYWWKDRFLIGIAGASSAVVAYLLGSAILFTLGILMLIVPVLLWVLLSWIARKSSEAPSFSLPLQLVLDESGISTTSSEGSSTNNWTQFCGWLETENAFLLYQTQYTAMTLPKRCMSSEQHFLVRELVSSHVQAKSFNHQMRRLTKIMMVCVLVMMAALSAFLIRTYSKTGHLPNATFDQVIFKWTQRL